MMHTVLASDGITILEQWDDGEPNPWDEIPVDPVVTAAETIQRHVDEQLAPTSVNTIVEVKGAISAGLAAAVAELRGE